MKGSFDAGLILWGTPGILQVLEWGGIAWREGVRRGIGGGRLPVVKGRCGEGFMSLAGTSLTGMSCLVDRDHTTDDL